MLYFQNGIETVLTMTVDSDPLGPGANNETAFRFPSSNWTDTRAGRPRILYRFEEDKEHNPRSAKPGPMMRNGQIVLDSYHNPVLDWDIPKTLSSKCPPYKMEVWRRMYMTMGPRDSEQNGSLFLLLVLLEFAVTARMPRPIEKDMNGNEIILDDNDYCNMPIQRFRAKIGSISWVPRKGSQEIREGLIALVKSEGDDPTSNNSTWELDVP